MRKKWLLLIPVILIVVYWVGPAPASPRYNKEMPAVPAGPAQLEAYIGNQEAQHKLKQDNEARIVWEDTMKRPTDYSIVYLHGFSASQGEGAPLHTDIAREFGCNLYLSRLAEHGIDTVDAMINLTADELWESGKEALAIGQQIGKKVILMGTSTGATLALQLAAVYPDRVAALILMSPNIEINDPNAWVLHNHWGLQIARMVKSSKYIEDTADRGPLYDRYWYRKYRLESAVALGELLATTMDKETFSRVTQPVGMYYFYKDEAHQDSIVRVSAMLRMYDQLGTPSAMKVKQAFPNAGTHVICSPIRSQDAEGVERAVEAFMKEVLHVNPVRGK
ncbi:MAG: alpha/beta hydrolase [Bacteroidota bacterium]|nr:alpha/beta hydrolase [Bacteroidota bacterium]MDP4216665.1 alpha/beta hydrolase [Bacteroidota bacterium]MDP4246758.1 alpha/beta hydrolase [Bacteroidota bacterium]MDP4260639.1 alpha/beta hydrolase [Bacteroidota bacterium]